MSAQKRNEKKALLSIAAFNDTAAAVYIDILQQQVATMHGNYLRDEERQLKQ
jgi:hypothetical protein